MPDNFDAFDDAFRNKFGGDGKVPTPEGLWERIEADLEPEKPNRIVLTTFFTLLFTSLTLFTFQRNAKDFYLAQRIGVTNYPAWLTSFEDMNSSAFETFKLDQQSFESIQDDLWEYSHSLVEEQNRSTGLLAYNSSTSNNGNTPNSLTIERNGGLPPSISAFKTDQESNSGVSNPLAVAIDQTIEKQKELPDVCIPDGFVKTVESSQVEESAKPRRYAQNYFGVQIGVASISVNPNLVDQEKIVRETFGSSGISDRMVFSFSYGREFTLNQSWKLFGGLSIVNFSSQFQYNTVGSEQTNLMATGLNGDGSINGLSNSNSYVKELKVQKTYSRASVGASYAFTPNKNLRVFSEVGVQALAISQEMLTVDGEVAHKKKSFGDRMTKDVDLDFTAGFQFTQRISEDLLVDIQPAVKVYSSTSFNPSDQFGYKRVMPSIGFRFRGIR